MGTLACNKKNEQTQKKQKREEESVTKGKITIFFLSSLDAAAMLAH